VRVLPPRDARTASDEIDATGLTASKGRGQPIERL